MPDSSVPLTFVLAFPFFSSSRCVIRYYNFSAFSFPQRFFLRRLLLSSSSSVLLLLLVLVLLLLLFDFGVFNPRGDSVCSVYTGAHTPYTPFRVCISKQSIHTAYTQSCCCCCCRRCYCCCFGVHILYGGTRDTSSTQKTRV